MEDAGRLDALVLKLRHPLPKIRFRALRSLLFKLRERLVHWRELEPLQSSVIPSLLNCLTDPTLELLALHVLQLVAQSGSIILLSSLQHFGAAQSLQRAANNNQELQETYEKLLRQIYVTQLASKVEQELEQNELKTEEFDEVEAAAAAEVEMTTAAVLNARRPPKVAELEARGWRFAPVALTTVDEQHLFEFEVKLQLRTETEEIVAACATFRNDLLRNFPAEVFLQRPAVLQYLLHLVQQPILPGSPDTQVLQSGDNMMERAMEVSLGVNYFDEMLNSTFSHKRGNLSGAVVMAALKALESFLSALQLTRRTCLDPTYVVHEPTVHIELLDSFDSRRGRYPRSRMEIEDSENKVRRSDRSGDDIDLLEQYSLSGAIYRIFMAMLPLLRSARHPRLHILNFLIAALPDLPERSRSATEACVDELDIARLGRIFELLSGICRPASLEHTTGNVIDDDLELTFSTTWKLVELALRLLQLYPASRYRVERISNESNGTEGAAQTNDCERVLVPRRLWQAVKLWISNPVFAELATQAWKDASLVQCLSEIDDTIPAFISLKHSSREDAKLVLKFVDFARSHHQEILDFSSQEMSAILCLDVAQKAILARHAFDAADNDIIADATIQTIWTVLMASTSSENGRVDDNDVEAIQRILRDLIGGIYEQIDPTSPYDSMGAHFLRGLVDLINRLDNDTALDYQRQVVAETICDPKTFNLVLLTLASTDSDVEEEKQVYTAPLWGILRWTLGQLASASSDSLAILLPVVPLLQHFAYIEPSEKSTSEQRSVQPQLAEILNRVETVVSDSTRYLLIGRCLLHQSVYIRKAAASGLLQLLSRVSTTANWIAKNKEIREDPFGSSFTSNGKSVKLDTKIMETPLPVIQRTNGYQPSESELSSQLSKLTHLCKVISGTSSAFESMKEAALKELVLLLENASVELFSLFEEVGKLMELVMVIRSIFQAETCRTDTSVIRECLLLFRVLLLRSALLRSAMQHDGEMMELILALIFHSSVLIRTQMYYIVLLLTCSIENFVLKEASPTVLKVRADCGDEATIPEMIKSTFGLYSSRWSRCFVTTCTLSVQLQACSDQLTERADASWASEIKAIINQTPPHSEGEEHAHDEHTSNEVLSLLSGEYEFIVQKLRAAPSHGRCLNALYHLTTICEAWTFARTRFVGEWEAHFERFFDVPPKSDRDEVILGSLVSTISVMFCTMSRGEQLRTLVVVKRKVLPLLRKSQCMAFSFQVVRLLLNMSSSKVGDLFMSLAADTDIISTICTKYSAIYSTEPVLHSMVLEVLLQFAMGMDVHSRTRLSRPSSEKIRKRLLEMVSPLLTIVCRHRVPGSFLGRDAFVAGSQCMVAILRALPYEALISCDSPLQHTDSKIFLDGSWASRFLFDHVSPIRELGFVVVEHAASSGPPSFRLLEMSFETATDETEPDAVRAPACSVLVKELIRHHERSPDRQAEMIEVFHGTKFAQKMLSTLSTALKDNHILPRSASVLAQVARVLYTRRGTLSPLFGDMGVELEAAEREYDIYPLLVQALSLREWKDKSDRYCSYALLLPGCDSDAWRRSVLPGVLDLMIEVLNLLQIIINDFGADQATYFMTHTTLQYQLMELVADVYGSLANTVSNDYICERSAMQNHYKVLDLCASTLSTLLMHRRDSGSENPGAANITEFEMSFAEVVAKLLESRHPLDFRVSFSRIVPTISLMIPRAFVSLDASVANALCSAVFDLYREIAEFRPLGAVDESTTSTETHGSTTALKSIQRVSCALQVLLESSPVMRHLFLLKRGLSFATISIKQLFTAIRLAGGFGGKRSKGTNTNTNSQDAYVLDLCGRIRTHMEVLSSLVGDDKDNQQLAKNEGLLRIVLSNWNLMKIAHLRGSQLILSALRFVANYSYGNDSAKGSLLAILPSPTGKNVGGDSGQSVILLLFDLVSTRGEVAHRISGGGAVAPSASDMVLSNTACQILKSVLLNAECVLASVKTGSISKLVDALQDRLQQTRQTSKTDQLEFENLAHMLSVLGSIACSEEGARVLYASYATSVSLIMDDMMNSSNDLIRRNGCMFLRNLALSQATKNNFALWEERLDAVVAACVHESKSAQDGSTALEYLSTTLWSLVYDNQKARALLLSRPNALQNLQQILESRQSDLQISLESEEPQTFSKDIVENLRRVLLLVRE